MDWTENKEFCYKNHVSGATICTIVGESSQPLILFLQEIPALPMDSKHGDISNLCERRWIIQLMTSTTGESARWKIEMNHTLT